MYASTFMDGGIPFSHFSCSSLHLSSWGFLLEFRCSCYQAFISIHLLISCAVRCTSSPTKLSTSKMTQTAKSWLWNSRTIEISKGVFFFVRFLFCLVHFLYSGRAVRLAQLVSTGVWSSMSDCGMASIVLVFPGSMAYDYVGFLHQYWLHISTKDGAYRQCELCVLCEMLCQY